MVNHSYEFFSNLAGVFNSEQSRAVILCGNVYDLLFHAEEYKPLLPFVAEKTETKGLIRVVYELNGPIRVLNDRDKLKSAWISWKAGLDYDTLLVKGMQSKGQSELDRLSQEFDKLQIDAIGNPTLALEVLRQMTICSRYML